MRIQRPIAPPLLASLALLAAAEAHLLGAATPHAQSAPPARAVVAVSGVVYDSLARAPLAAAEVQLLRDDSTHRAYDAHTDERGRFVIDDVEPGVYLAGVFHPRLDSLGVDVPTARVAIAADAPARLALGVPSRETVLRALCPASLALTDSSTLVHGVVRDARTRTPRGGAVVGVEWTEVVIGGGGLASARRRGVVDTGADGAFAICNAPGDAELLVRATEGADTSGVVVLRLGADRILGRDLYVGGARAAEAAGAAPAGIAPVRRGEARLAGTVRGGAGEPVAGARVAVWGSEGEAVSGADGAFRLGDLPAGTHTVEVRALGYEPARLAVDLLVGEGVTNVASLALTRHRPALDTVRVIANADVVLTRSGFSARRRAGQGHFIDREMLDKRSIIQTTGAIQTIAGLEIRATQRGRAVLMRDGRGETCTPTVFIDGARYDPRSGDHGFVDIDALTDPDRIAGIEIYSRPGQAPLQFSGTSEQGCGVVVIWNKTLAPEKR